MKSRMKCFKSPSLSRVWKILASIISYFVYLVLGGIVFTAIEKQTDLELKTVQKNKFLQTLKKYNLTINDTMVLEIATSAIKAHSVQALNVNNFNNTIASSWNIGSGMFYCSTLVTTIGYGNISPKTTTGRLFTIVYALFGIPITGIVLAKIGLAMTACVSKADTFLELYLRNIIGRVVKNNKSIKRYVRIGEIVMTLLVFVLLFWILPAAVMTQSDNWSFMTSVYFCFISLTTIGLGDVVPGSASKQFSFKSSAGAEDLKAMTLQVSVIFYLLMGLAGLTIILGLLSSLFTIAAESAIEGINDEKNKFADKAKNLSRRIVAKTNQIVPININLDNKKNTEHSVDNSFPTIEE